MQTENRIKYLNRKYENMVISHQIWTKLLIQSLVITQTADINSIGSIYVCDIFQNVCIFAVCPILKLSLEVL